MKVYNTMSRTKEEFRPIRSECVTIYSCGPTVYNYAHIGNMRTYVFMDLLRRVLKLNGYRLRHVLNLSLIHIYRLLCNEYPTAAR